MSTTNPTKIPNPSTYKQVLENYIKLLGITEQMQAVIEQLGDVDSLKQTFESIQQSITDLNQSVTDMGKDLDKTKETVNGLDEEFDKLGETVTNLDKEVDTLGENYEALDKEVETLDKDLEQTKETVTDLNEAVLVPPPTGGTVMTPEGIKVIGIHTNRNNLDTDTAPSSYSQGLTLELKLASAIGLSGKDGIAKPYVFVLTFVQDTGVESENTVPDADHSPMQIAYANDGAIQYNRFAANDTWGSWAIMGDGVGGGTVVEQVDQIITSDTQPSGQPEGHFWCEPID